MPYYTCEQVGHLRHALGLDYGVEPYRDYFAACPGDPDDKLWAGMVELGLAYLHSGPTELFPYNCYRTTELGRSVAKREPQPAKSKEKTSAS